MLKNRRIDEFITTIIVLSLILVALVFSYALSNYPVGQLMLIAAIFVGSLELIKITWENLMHRRYSIDYIAILAITIALLTQEYLAGSVIVLMLSGGNALERYASKKARESLTKLTQRIPNEVFLFENGKVGEKVAINDVRIGNRILIRRGEVIPLDGILLSETSRADESSLTGEPFLIDKVNGDLIRSGTINVGPPMVIRVIKENRDSTYTKIIEMVKKAQEEKPRLVRLASKYNILFTIVTLLIALLTYLFSHDYKNVLAVLVIATPCPLILATPIALIGGMNSAAKRKIIIKRLSSLEVLSRVDALIFDKTGTLTLGKPQLISIELKNTKLKEKDILALAAAIEHNSLHPIAKSIVHAARLARVKKLKVTQIEEIIGSHIAGAINGKRYILIKPINHHRASLEVYEETKGKRTLLAAMYFEDKLKNDTKKIITELSNDDLIMKILTGDKNETTKALVEKISKNIDWKAECTPEDKQKEIDTLRSEGHIVAMVGDGINDAPALAKADVGLVFSHEDRTAASEAADVVFLGGDFSSVYDALKISKQTVKIAKQSILVGISLSTIGMLFAAFGFIVPIAGAFIQEAIDIAVIFNSLRTSRY